MFFNNIYLKPTEAKLLFTKKFDNIDLSDPETNKIIKNKYRLCSQINNDKIKNTNNIFLFNDENGKNISYTYTYYNDEEDIEKKLI